MNNKRKGEHHLTNQTCVVYPNTRPTFPHICLTLTSMLTTKHSSLSHFSRQFWSSEKKSNHFEKNKINITLFYFFYRLRRSPWISKYFHSIGGKKAFTEFVEGGWLDLIRLLLHNPFFLSSYFFDPSMDSEFWTSRLAAAKRQYALQHNHPSSHLGWCSWMFPFFLCWKKISGSDQNLIFLCVFFFLISGVCQIGWE